MLSRTADDLYWLARYVERAEYLARILEAAHRVTALPLAYAGASNEWESAVATAGCVDAFAALYPGHAFEKIGPLPKRLEWNSPSGWPRSERLGPARQATEGHPRGHPA